MWIWDNSEYWYHPISLLLGLILYIITICFTPYSFLFIPLLLIFLWKSVKQRQKVTKILAIFTILVVVFNIFCGKLLVLGKICTILVYCLSMKKNIPQQAFSYYFDHSLYRVKNEKLIRFYLNCNFAPSIFRMNWREYQKRKQTIDFNFKIKIFLYQLKNSYNKTLSDLQKIYETYQIRFYGIGNKRTEITKYKWEYPELLYIISHSLFLIIILIIRRNL